jgi:CubicO group peptidase (beta-lactamase class C family)
MKPSLAGVAGACVLACVTALAQTTDSTAVKERLEVVAKSYTAGNAFMGTVLVAEGDHILLNQGYGMADLEWNIPNSPEIKFRLGSLTKQFTATLVLLLQQDGKLHIEDPVAKYLPDAPKSWEKITLTNLLGHTSGIPNFTNAAGDISGRSRGTSAFLYPPGKCGDRVSARRNRRHRIAGAPPGRGSPGQKTPGKLEINRRSLVT